MATPPLQTHKCDFCGESFEGRIIPTGPSLDSAHPDGKVRLFFHSEVNDYDELIYAQASAWACPPCLRRLNDLIIKN